MTYYIGIDQSYSCTGITLLNEDGEIVDSTAFPMTSDFFKFYASYGDFRKTYAYQSGLVDENMKLTKKKSELTKQESDLLKVSQTKRIAIICQSIENWIKSFDVANIVAGLENISLGSKGVIVDLARLLGAIEHHLQMMGVEHVLFPPTQVKSFAGKGNFSKDEMVAVVPEADLEKLKTNLPVDKKGEVVGLTDAVDSYWLAKLAKAHFDKDKNPL